MAELAPPNAHLVELASARDSKIQHISLYTGLGEVTRVCTAKLKAGSNKVVISGLPNVMLHESLRVEGRGPCIIHEVSISQIPVEAPRITSPKIEELLKQKTCLDKALVRTNKVISGIDNYQKSFGTKTVEAKDLAAAALGAESVSAQFDDKLLDLEEKLEQLQTEIADERKQLGEVNEDDKLRQRVSIMIFAEKECEVELVLIYGVREATWDAVYDIYVTMDTKEKPVSLIYKSGIMQSTGETWEDVSLTLETATPTFGVSMPVLRPITLSVYAPPVRSMKSKKKSKGLSFGIGGGGGSQGQEMMRGRLAAFTQDDSSGSEGEMRLMPLSRRVHVSSKGDINATFSIPGLTSIPSDGTVHNVTITDLDLDATMSWITVPKKSTKAHLTAKIKNDSEFTFLRGTASIYVDGSFISRSDVPAVSPQESFDCPLGIDPSIRIVYHPRSKKANRTGFTRKTSNSIFEQRITVTNTKSSAIENLKVLEQFPVSEDAAIVVNLLNPPLVIPQANKKGEFEKPEPVKIGQVSAQWEGADDSATDPGSLGKDGKFGWDCSLASQGKLSLVLSWEVVCPTGTDVVGLDDTYM